MEKIVLCASSAYEEKYYFNVKFQGLPEPIKEELQIMCVQYTMDVGGILALEYNEEGKLYFQASADEGDLLYDEIGSVLKVKQLQNEKKELLESLELYYQVFYLHKEKALFEKEDKILDREKGETEE